MEGKVIFMRKYKGNYLTAVICNCCGKNLVVANGIVREGVAHICAEWDYFSEKTEKTTALMYVRNVMTGYALNSDIL